MIDRIQNFTESSNSTDLHGLTSDFKVAVVTIVIFTYMDNLLFLLCNVYIDRKNNLRLLTFDGGLIIKWFKDKCKCKRYGDFFGAFFGLGRKLVL